MYGKTIGVITLAALTLAVVGTTITVQHVFAAPGPTYMDYFTRLEFLLAATWGV